MINVAAALQTLFFATRDRVGRQLVDKRDSHGRPIFGPWRDHRNSEGGREWSFRQITPDMTERHIAGTLLYRSERARLQTYTVSEGCQSVLTAIDLDVTEHGTHSDQPQHFATTADALVAARRIVEECDRLGVTSWTEITKSAGVRVWIFYATPIPAAAANAFGRLLVVRAALHRDTEVFPNTLRELAAPVLLPYAGVADPGRQVMLRPGTDEPMPIAEFVPAALETRADASLVIDIVEQSVVAGEVKRLTASSRVEGTAVVPVTDEEAKRRWQFTLDRCVRSREIVERAETGQQLSYQDWMRLATQLRIHGEWGHAEFHRLSALDDRYNAAEAEDLFDSLNGGPARCDKMGCSRDPHKDCGLPAKNVSPAYFGALAAADLRFPAEYKASVWSPNTERHWPIPDPAVYHGLLGEIVRVIDPHTESDPMAVLISLQVGFGNLIGRSPYFLIESTRHYANLNVVIVGKSAVGRKGTAWDHARSFLRSGDPLWALGRILSGLSSGEGLLYAVRDPMEKSEPTRDRDKKITGYEKVVVDEGESDKRLLVIETEFAKVLKVIQREGNSLSAMLRQAWDSGDLRVMTKQAQLATGAHISIIGHITQDELLRELDDTEVANGLANRFLWISVKRSKMLAEGGKLESVYLEPLYERLMSAATFASTVQDMRRDDDARAIWSQVYPTLTREEPGLFGALIARAAPIVLRLSMIYALLDKSSVIRPEHQEAALAVWQYAEDSARFIFGRKLGDPMADEILKALRQRPDGMTQTDIRDLFGRNPKASTYLSRLELLQSQGLVRCQREETGGKPAIRWLAVGV